MATVRSMRKELHRARDERSPRRALGNMLAAMQVADRIWYAREGFSETEKKEAYFTSEYIAEHLMSWAVRAKVGKGEINEVLDSCLREEKEEAPPKKRVVTVKSDMEALFRGVNEGSVTVRTLNALYRFSQKMDEDRKRGLGTTHSASPVIQALAPKYPHWYEGYPAPKTVGDLTKWTTRKLLQIKDLGPKSVDHLEAVLNKAGFQLEEG